MIADTPFYTQAEAARLDAKVKELLDENQTLRKEVSHLRAWQMQYRYERFAGVMGATRRDAICEDSPKRSWLFRLLS